MSASRGFLGAGDLYIRRYVAGAYEDWEGPFECDKFEIKPNSDLKEMESKGRDTYGQTIESVSVPKPFDLKVALTEVNKTSMAIALFGTVAALAQSSGTVATGSPESVVVKLGRWKPMAHAAIDMTTPPVVKDSGGTTTYVAGVDYLINPQLGWIKALVGGSIADAATVKISYAYSAITGSEIKGATQSQVRAQFKLNGKNFADELPCIVSVHEAVLSADSAFDFLGSDFNKVDMPARMKTPVGFTEPFTVHLRDA